MKKFMFMACAAVMMSTPALADYDGKHEKKMEKKVQYYFDKLDANGDGVITRSEHNDFATKMFEETDADNSDTLTVAELKDQKKEEWKEMKDKMGHDKHDKE